jgi:multidrug efflux pump subunit AcrA (membrane-fusion protein)
VSAQAPPPTVEIAEAAQGDADIYVEYPGQTYARNMVDVRGRVEGYIEKWLFRPGQEVTAGQPLYILDLRPFQAQVQQAQGTLHQTEADLILRSTRFRCGRRRPTWPPRNPTW